MQIGDWVEVIRQSTNYNPHIRNVGYVGEITDMNEHAVQIECLNGGMGAVDRDCVKVVPKPSLGEIYRRGLDQI
jgi:hypothetical protein